MSQGKYNDGGRLSYNRYSASNNVSSGGDNSIGCGFILFVLFGLFLIGSFLVWAIA